MNDEAANKSSGQLENKSESGLISHIHIDKRYLLNKYVIIGGLVLVLAILITWIITTSSFFNSAPQQPTIPKLTTETLPTPPIAMPTVNPASAPPLVQNKPAKRTPPKPPPKPDVYWSSLSNQLITLEKEQTRMLMTFNKQATPATKMQQPTEEKPVHLQAEESLLYETRSEPAEDAKIILSTPANLSWAVVGKQLIQLEQQQRKTTTLLIND